MVLTVDELSRCREIAQRWKDSTTGNWILETDSKKAGENWLVCFGNSSNGHDYYLTTDRVRASELSGDAKNDGELIVNAKPDIEFLLRLVQRLTA